MNYTSLSCVSARQWVSPAAMSTTRSWASSSTSLGSRKMASTLPLARQGPLPQTQTWNIFSWIFYLIKIQSVLPGHSTSVQEKMCFQQPLSSRRDLARPQSLSVCKPGTCRHDQVCHYHRLQRTKLFSHRPILLKCGRYRKQPLRHWRCHELTMACCDQCYLRGLWFKKQYLNTRI